MEGNEIFLLISTNSQYRYWLIHFYTNPSFIQKLRSSMKASPDIIRHTITKLSDGIKVDDILHPHSISSLQSYIASQK